MQNPLRTGLLGLTILLGGSTYATAQVSPRPGEPTPFPAGNAFTAPQHGSSLPPSVPSLTPPPAPMPGSHGPSHGAAHGGAHGAGEHGSGHGEHKVPDLTPPELANLSEHGHGSEPYHGVDFGPSGPLAPRVWAFGEYLLLRPRINGLDYAISDPSNNATPTGLVERVNYDTQSGLRVGAGFRPGGSCWDVSFAYTYLHAEGSQQATAPGGGTLYALLTRPGVIDNVVSAGATAALDYHIYDILGGRTFCIDPTFDLRLVTGVRLANIRTDFNSDYNGGDANLATVRSSTRFTGAGLTVGGQGDWKVTDALSVFGRAQGSLMYGDIKNRLLATNNAGATTDADLTDANTQIIPVAELGAGLTYRYRMVSVSAGYEVTNWFNLIDRQLFIDDFSEGRFERRVSDLSLEGIFVRLGLTF